MKKKYTILVVSYSQTGQLEEIVGNFLVPFKEYSIDWVKVEPLKAYPFPWNASSFFDLMPECVLEKPTELKPFSIPSISYDLVILGYQPWFLSPSQPATSIFQNEEFRRCINGKPVITIVGSRNMWINSQISIINQIDRCGGILVGNIPLIDRNSNLISAVTILHWMLNGRKDKLWGVFPKPGVSDKDIQGAVVFGKVVKETLEEEKLHELQDKLLATDQIGITTTIIFIEERAKKLFSIWAKVITKRGTTPFKRKVYVKLFEYYLIVALFIVAPIVLSLFFTLFYPFSKKRVKQKREFYLKGIIKAKDARRLHYKNREILT